MVEAHEGMSFFPEKGEIRYNGVRQFLQEDLDHLVDYARAIAQEEVILRVTEEPSRRARITKLRDRFFQLRGDFLTKWDKKKPRKRSP